MNNEKLKYHDSYNSKPNDYKLNSLSDFLTNAIQDSENHIKDFEDKIKKDKINIGYYCMLYSERNHLQVLKMLSFLTNDIIQK